MVKTANVMNWNSNKYVKLETITPPSRISQKRKQLKINLCKRNHDIILNPRKSRVAYGSREIQRSEYKAFGHAFRGF